VLLLIVAVVLLVAVAYGIAYYQLVNTTDQKNCGVYTYGQQPAPGC